MGTPPRGPAGGEGSGQGGGARGPADPHGPPLASLPEPLPKPSLQALPSPLVPLDKPVTLHCQGPPGVHLYRLEKLRSGKYEDKDTLYIPAMRQSAAGLYRCSYQNGSRWSPPSEQLKLVATGNRTDGRTDRTGRAGCGLRCGLRADGAQFWARRGCNGGDGYGKLRVSRGWDEGGAVRHALGLRAKCWGGAPLIQPSR